MAAFNLEHEQKRLVEIDSNLDRKISSVKKNLWTLLNERTETLGWFGLEVDSDKKVVAEGYEQRGDLGNSYKLSVDYAPNNEIAKRYKLENDGYEKAKELLINSPLYSTVILASPPSEIKIDGYGDQSLMYFYHILPGETEDTRTIKALSWMNKLTREEQAEILNSFKVNKDVEPTAESILNNPVESVVFSNDTESFSVLWNKVEEVYSRKDRDFFCLPFTVMEQYLLNGDKLRERDNPVLTAMINEIAQRIARGDSAEDLETQWDIMLNLADLQLLHKEDSSLAEPFPRGTQLEFDRKGVIFKHYKHLAYEPRQMETPCGHSGGLGVNNRQQYPILTTTFTMSKNIAGKTSLAVPISHEKTLKCTCPFCQKKVEATIKDKKIICPNCSKSAKYEC